ncbi:MAG: ABC-three component system protein [Planctomycetota bacterium]
MMQPDEITQSNNIAGRDMAAGDIVHINMPRSVEASPLSNLMTKLREEINRAIKSEETLAALKRYETNVDSGEIIGLEAKLKRGQREDLIERAMFYKEEFVKELSKKRLYQTAQRIYVELLEIVFHKFRMCVAPLICSGAAKHEVDKAISEQVTHIMENMIRENIDLFSAGEIEGMFYFLTGSCHINWDVN